LLSSVGPKRRGREPHRVRNANESWWSTLVVRETQTGEVLPSESPLTSNADSASNAIGEGQASYISSIANHASDTTSAVLHTLPLLALQFLGVATSRLDFASTSTRLLRGLWVWMDGLHVSYYVLAWRNDLVLLDVDCGWGAVLTRWWPGWEKPPARQNRWWHRFHIPTRGEEMCGGFLLSPGTARDCRNHQPTP